jgi:hypothetical protein
MRHVPAGRRVRQKNITPKPLGGHPVSDCRSVRRSERERRTTGRPGVSPVRHPMSVSADSPGAAAPVATRAWVRQIVRILSGDPVMSIRKFLSVAMIAASAILTPAPASAETHRLVLDVRTAPPAPRVEVVPAARRGWYWAPGYWTWRHHRHVWVRGHWIRARYGHHWASPRWVEHGSAWRMERGRWERD